MEFESGIDLVGLLVDKPTLPLPVKVDDISPEERAKRRNHLEVLKKDWNKEKEVKDFNRMAEALDEIVGRIDAVTASYKMMATQEHGCRSQVEAIQKMSGIVESLQYGLDVARGIFAIHLVKEHSELPQDATDYLCDYLLAMGENKQAESMAKFIDNILGSLFGGAKS